MATRLLLSQKTAVLRNHPFYRAWAEEYIAADT